MPMTKAKANLHLLAGAFVLVALVWPGSPLGLTVLVNSCKDVAGVSFCIQVAFVSLALCLQLTVWEPTASRIASITMMISGLAALSALGILLLSLASKTVPMCILLVYGSATGGCYGLTLTRFSVYCLVSDTPLKFVQVPTIALALLFVVSHIACSMGLSVQVAMYLIVSGLIASIVCIFSTERRPDIKPFDQAFQDEGSLKNTKHPLGRIFSFAGFGVALYIGTPLMMALHSGSIKSIASPWFVFVLAFAGSMVAVTLSVNTLLSERHAAFTYGFIAHYVGPLTVIYILGAVIVLSYNAEIGALLIAPLPAIGIGGSMVIIDESYRENTSAQKISEILLLLRRFVMGMIIGSVALSLLWMIDEAYLRFQLLSVLMVVTCTSGIPRMPRKTATARDLFYDVLPEDMSMEERYTRTSEAVAKKNRLSTREQEVLTLLVTGASQKEIALALGITVKTSRRHVESIYKKLDVHSIGELMSFIRNAL